jgi:hypothetical protein
MEFESDASTTRSTKIDGDIPQPIPGRGQGSGRGHVQCDEDISRLVSYWNDPRSDFDCAFRSPFLGPTTASRSIPGRRRYLSFEPDKVIIILFCCVRKITSRILLKHKMIICCRVDGIIFGWSLKSW